MTEMITSEILGVLELNSHRSITLLDTTLNDVCNDTLSGARNTSRDN